MCPVGLKLYAEAKKEPEKAYKPKSFPFVAKLYERIKGSVGNEWVECVVVDRSIAAAGRIIPGSNGYRAKTSGVIGYEVETDDKERHYVNSGQIQPLKPRPRKAILPAVGPAAKASSSILVILRRSE